MALAASASRSDLGLAGAFLMTLPSRFGAAGLSKDTSAARGAPAATAGASFFAAFAAFAAFGAAFVGAGAAAGASRTIGFAAAGFVSRSAASWRWNSVRPAAGPAALAAAGASATASSAKTLIGAAATPASATPAASVPSCLLRACVRCVRLMSRR